MNKKLKPLVLIATLAIPVAIFIFLKAFGSNDFNIPIYYQNGATPAFSECSHTSTQFYVAQKWLAPSKPNVISFYAPETDVLTTLSNIRERLNAVFNTKISVKLMNAHEGDILDLMHCQFVTDTLHQLILVDEKRRIRGYYGIGLDEVDRLMVETKILIEN